MSYNSFPIPSKLSEFEGGEAIGDLPQITEDVTKLKEDAEELDLRVTALEEGGGGGGGKYAHHIFIDMSSYGVQTSFTIFSDRNTEYSKDNFFAEAVAVDAIFPQEGFMPATGTVRAGSVNNVLTRIARMGTGSSSFIRYWYYDATTAGGSGSGNITSGAQISTFNDCVVKL